MCILLLCSIFQIKFELCHEKTNVLVSDLVGHQGSHRPGKVLEFDLGPGKLLEFQKSAICPGIVLEFCKIVLENVKLSLKIIKYTNSFPFFFINAMCEKKLCENCWIR